VEKNTTTSTRTTTTAAICYLLLNRTKAQQAALIFGSLRASAYSGVCDIGNELQETCTKILHNRAQAENLTPVNINEKSNEKPHNLSVLQGLTCQGKE